MLTSYAGTHIGRRKANEDSYFSDDNLGLYIVADGVGGLEKGEVASKLACEIIIENIKMGNSLTESIISAHKALITEKNYNRGRQGMATTIAAVHFDGNAYEIAWVGDSRVYLWDGNIHLLTKDDSYVEQLVDGGYIDLPDIETHPERHIISQALGVERKEIIVHTNSGTLEKDQMLLICSDGLYDMVPEESVYSKIHHNKESLESLTDNLINAAVQNGGKDNITLISIRSNSDTVSGKPVQMPTVFRHLDKRSGHMRNENNASSNTKFSTKSHRQKLKEEQIRQSGTEEDLVNQTKMRELTKEDIQLLDTMAEKAQNDKKTLNKNSGGIVIAIIVSTLAIIALLIMK